MAQTKLHCEYSGYSQKLSVLKYEVKKIMHISPFLNTDSPCKQPLHSQ